MIRLNNDLESAISQKRANTVSQFTARKHLTEEYRKVFQEREDVAGIMEDVSDDYWKLRQVGSRNDNPQVADNMEYCIAGLRKLESRYNELSLELSAYQACIEMVGASPAFARKQVGNIIASRESYSPFAKRA